MQAIRDIMTVDVFTASEEQPLTDAVKLMAEKALSCIVIVKEDRPIGIITQGDLINKVLTKEKKQENLKVKDVMTSPIITITPEVEFGDALSIMESNRIKKLIIVEDDTLAGIITTSDIAARSSIINSYNKKLTFYQNIQSYIIFIFFIFIVIYLVIKYLQ